MATYTGKDGAVYSGGVPIGEVRDWSIEQSANRVDDTVMGDDWMTGKVTQKSWTASVNVYYDPNDIIEVGDLLTLNLYPQGNTSGLKYFSGEAHVTSFSSSASFDGMIEASISFDGTGPLTIQTA